MLAINALSSVFVLKDLPRSSWEMMLLLRREGSTSPHLFITSDVFFVSQIKFSLSPGYKIKKEKQSESHVKCIT